MTVGILNVEGLRSMLGNKAFIELIQQWDVVGLVETWIEEKHKVNIIGYDVYGEMGKRRSNRGRSSGGIMVLVKEKLRNKVKQIQLKTEGMVWLLMEAKEEVIVMGFMYNPPKGSNFENNEFFEEMAIEIERINIIYSITGLVCTFL